VPERNPDTAPDPAAPPPYEPVTEPEETPMSRGLCGAIQVNGRPTETVKRATIRSDPLVTRRVSVPVARP
jgi:hypothetical protein